ncbi:low-density lipoprotein receptor class A [Elysia marginata]|uniref:Low-density lipoprotein receptor class A n=1 Tax=Elysia marginata TaxID=1093978 RepID=A0AAV4JQU2_9GAST|nr:low-density lipoprotein receptor class A [Elysia marginata]
MGGWNKMLPKVLSAALLVATMAMNSRPLHAHPPGHLTLSENSKTGNEGSNIQVNCSVSMSGTPKELKWELSSDMKGNVKQVVLSKTTVALRITSLKRTNAGQYSCLLIMPDGKEEKKPFMLLVQQANDEVCTKFQFKCEKTRDCLFIKYRCDGVDDCGDGSDEQCDGDPCADKFRCNNSRCIDHKFVCDNMYQCGDHSDEEHCDDARIRSTSTAQPVSDDNTYAWLQITVSSFIAVTLGLVFFISFIVIMVFRNRVRRMREQRIARALEQMYQEDERLNRHGDHMGGSGVPPNSGQGLAGDQQQFLLGPPHPHYGNIIVNVNNGVQYIPGYDYAIVMDVPPPYSEVGTAQSGETNPPPPAYSTLEGARMGGPCSGQQAAAAQDGQTDQRHPQPGARCATVPAADVRSGNVDVSPNTGQQEMNCPNTRSDLCGNSQTLPSGIDINPHFLQSLLGPHLQAQAGDRSSPWTTGESASSTLRQDSRTLPTRSAPQDPSVNIMHLTASPQHRGSSSPSAHQYDVNQSGTPGEDATQAPLRQMVPIQLSDNQSASLNHNGAVLPSASENVGNCGMDDGDLSDDDCNQSLLRNEAASVENCGGQSMTGEEDEEESFAAAQNEDSTFLIRRPRQKESQDSGQTEAITPASQSSPYKRNADDASNALLNEVSIRDERLQPKPGHFTVQGGEILLHTPTGILCDSPQAPPSQSHSPPVTVAAAAPASPEVPELMIQNGSLVFGTPKPVAECEQTPHPNGPSQNPPASSATQASVEELERGHKSSTSSLKQAESADVTAGNAAAADPDEMTDTLRRKELQFKNGELVLESPKQTASAQILSHLKGAYAEEEGMAEAIEPVVNTKRSGGSVSAKLQPQKVNSDVVLPHKTYQQ